MLYTLLSTRLTCEPSTTPCRYEDNGEEMVMWQSLREMLLRVISGTQVPPPAYNKFDKEVAEFTKSGREQDAASRKSRIHNVA